MWAQKQKGFTIVELLIVIVVIAILAAITIVAYNGVQNRARISAVSSALSQANKKLAAFAVDGNGYPADLATIGINDSTDIGYQYSVNNTTNPATYCVTATSGTVSYKASSASPTPSSGGCAGHGTGGSPAITNLTNNPGSEAIALTLSNGGGSTIARATNLAHSGSASSLLTKGTGYGFARSGDTSSFGVGDDTVTFSAWVYTSEPSVLLVRRGNGVTYANYTKTVTPNTWTRISHTFVVPTGATNFYVDVGWEAGSAPTGATVYVDDVMATQGSTLYTYADGNSPNWAWTGTLNNSTSRGPAL